MITQFKKLAIADNSDLSVLAVVPNINEGVDGASAFFYSRSEDKINIEDSQEPIYKLSHEVRAVGLPVASVDTSDLDSLADLDNKVLATAVGIDGVLVFDDPVRLTWLDHFDNITAWKFDLNVHSYPEYTGGKAGGGVFVGENILALYENKGTDGVLNGFTVTNFVTSVDGSEQTLEHSDDGSTATFLFKKILFPFAGETLTLSADINNIVDNGHSAELVIRFYDSSDSEISTESVSFSSTGRKSITASVPTNTVKVEVGLESDDDGTATGTTSYDVQDFALRVDGQSKYTRY